MTAVMQNNSSLTINDDEDDVALAAFLAPNWGRFDQDQLAFDIMSYRQTVSEHHSEKQRKSSNGDIHSVHKSTSTPVLRSRDRQSMSVLPQQKHAVPRREDSPMVRQSNQRKDETPKHRPSSANSRRESPPSRSPDTSRDASPRRSSPHTPRSPHAYPSYPIPSEHKIPIPPQHAPKRIPTPLPLLAQSSAQFVQERRPSVTSVSSKAPSIRSEMSINTKLSLTKRLRRVFSMSSLKSKSNDSTVSLQSQVPESDISPKPSRSSTAPSSTIASQQQSMVDAAYSESALSSITGPQPTNSISSPVAKPASRRRSIVSLTNIFSRKDSSSGSNKQKAQQVEPTVATVIVPAETGTNQRHSTTDLRKIINDQNPDRMSPPPTSRHVPKGPERPKVDTSLASIQQPSKGSLKQARRGSASKAPDSPSSISSSSRSPVTPPPHRQLPRLQASYASVVSGANGRQRQSSLTSNSSARADYFGTGDFDPSEELPHPPSANFHSLPLHGSPRMKPASQSNTSLTEPTSIREMPPTMKSRRIGFSPSITVFETFSASEYDRRCDPNVTCCKLTPEFAMRIKQELNEYKLTSMEVHIESRQYTHFFL